MIMSDSYIVLNSLFESDNRSPSTNRESSSAVTKIHCSELPLRHVLVGSIVEPNVTRVRKSLVSANKQHLDVDFDHQGETKYKCSNESTDLPSKQWGGS